MLLQFYQIFVCKITNLHLQCRNILKYLYVHECGTVESFWKRVALHSNSFETSSFQESVPVGCISIKMFTEIYYTKWNENRLWLTIVSEYKNQTVTSDNQVLKLFRGLNQHNQTPLLSIHPNLHVLHCTETARSILLFMHANQSNAYITVSQYKFIYEYVYRYNTARIRNIYMKNPTVCTSHRSLRRRHRCRRCSSLQC